MDNTGFTIFHALVFLLAGGVVSVLASLGAQSRPDHHGWHSIKAGPMHWTGVGLGTVLSCLFAYIWLFVGSSRADAESQMRILFWLIIAFSSATIIVGLSIRSVTALAVRWRGDIVAFRDRSGATVKQRFGDVAEMRPTLLGRMSLRFQDGTEVHIDPYAQGASDLIDLIAEQIGPAGPRR